MKDSKKSKTPVLILCFAIFIIVTTLWWFAQLFINPETLTNPNNIFFTATKFGVLISGIGLLRMKKWAVYLYAGVYLVTAVSFFVFPAGQKLSAQVAPILIAFIFVAFTSLLALMFFKYWKRFT